MDTNIIDQLNQVKESIRRQDYKGAKDFIREVIGYFSDAEQLNVLINAYGDHEVKSIIAEMLTALEKDDMVRLADLIEGVCIPGICGCDFENTNLFKEDFYLERSQSGNWTVKYQPRGFYIHSQLDPMEEARSLVEHIYKSEFEEYVVWGCGLLYHVYQLWRIADGTVRIRVYDSHENMIGLANEYGPFDKIPEEIRVICDDGKEFAKDIKDGNVGILMHMPSIKIIKDQQVKLAIMRFFMAWNGGIQLKRLFDINFRVNMNVCKHNIYEKKAEFENREVVIVAAGPSVDDNIDFLRESVKSKRVIIAVNTIIRRLLDMNISPDYLAVMDCHSRTYKHMDGISLDSNISMIVDSTAYWKFAKLHKGESYIVLQAGYAPAEDEALKNGWPLFDTGSSVTIMVADVALRLGAETVFLVGADFAYRNGASHANGTVFRSEGGGDELFPVKGVNGEKVYTTLALDEYRHQMEEKVKEFPEAKVINCSRTGAHIEGTLENLI